MEHWILATNIKRKGIITDRWSKIQACEYLLRITLQLWLPSKQSNYIDQYKPSHCCLYADKIDNICVNLHKNRLPKRGYIYYLGFGIEANFSAQKGGKS